MQSIKFRSPRRDSLEVFDRVGLAGFVRLLYVWASADNLPVMCHRHAVPELQFSRFLILFQYLWQLVAVEALTPLQHIPRRTAVICTNSEITDLQISGNDLLIHSLRNTGAYNN